MDEGRPAHLPFQLPLRVPGQVGEVVVRHEDRRVLGDDEVGRGGALEDGPVLPLARPQRLLGALAGRNVDEAFQEAFPPLDRDGVHGLQDVDARPVGAQERPLRPVDLLAEIPDGAPPTLGGADQGVADLPDDPLSRIPGHVGRLPVRFDDGKRVGVDDQYPRVYLVEDRVQPGLAVQQLLGAQIQRPLQHAAVHVRLAVRAVDQVEEGAPFLRDGIRFAEAFLQLPPQQAVHLHRLHAAPTPRRTW